MSCPALLRARAHPLGGGGLWLFLSEQQHAGQIRHAFAEHWSVGRARRIALLFLARERIFHEDTWADWFSGVQGLVPRSAVRVSLPCLCMQTALWILLQSVRSYFGSV